MNRPRNPFTGIAHKSHRAIVKGVKQGSVGCAVIDFPFGTKWEDCRRVQIAVDQLRSLYDNVHVEVYDID